MQLKIEGSPFGHTNYFDLLGEDEIALSKALAFVLSKDITVLNEILRLVGIWAIDQARFKNTSINIEVVRDEGRTDIEVLNKNYFHLMIETKIRANKVGQQSNQYLSAIDKTCRKKVMCFITEELQGEPDRSSNDIDIKYLTWKEIFNAIAKVSNPDRGYPNELLRFYERKIKMKTEKEILVQDLGNETELMRYRKYNVYRRDKTFGSPLYFAPYFTRNAKASEGEGISYLSRVLGMLTIKADEVENYKEHISAFSDDEKTIKKWMEGVRFNLEQDQHTFTFYFLDDPVRIPKPLEKDRTILKGRGKNWIAAMIPKNRCVTFSEFVKRMNKTRV